MDNVLKIINCIVNVIIAIGGLSAFFTYFAQKSAKKKEAAALVVTQIEDLKEKILEINDIATDGKLNATEFYETLDIITDNQWEKYRHLFIKKIDSYSYRNINKFYDCALGIREQLLFVKQLQHGQYMNIQAMLDNNCNQAIFDAMKNIDPTIASLDTIVKQLKPTNDDEKNVKEFMNNKISDMINSNSTQGTKKILENYYPKMNKIREIANSKVYINYIPDQVYVTLSKLINDIRTIEVIGCTGYKKIKKIAKIK